MLMAYILATLDISKMYMYGNRLWKDKQVHTRWTKSVEDGEGELDFYTWV